MVASIDREDEVDREILPLLYEVGSLGVLPKDLVVKVETFKVTRHQTSRRILRMNGRLEKELGEHVAEMRGWHRALTGFVMEAWDETKPKIDQISIQEPLKTSLNSSLTSVTLSD